MVEVDNKMDINVNGDVDDDKDKEKKKMKDKDRDRSKERDKDNKDRKRGRDDRHSRSRDRDREGRDRGKDRDRDRKRSRDRRRSRSRERGRRSRSRDRGRRSRSRDRDYDDRNRRDRDRKRSRSNDRSRKNKDNDNNENSNNGEFDKSKPVTLKEILKTMPHLSKAEAVTYMNKHNSEALGVELDPNLTSSILASSINPTGGVSNPALGGGLGGAATKVHREIYIGNTPPSWPPQRIAQLFDDTMKQRGIAKNPQGLSVLNCRVGSDGHHAFIEFYSIEEAAYCLYHLNGMVVGTNPLRISRPSGYVFVPGISDIVAVPNSAVAKGTPFIPLLPPKDNIDTMLTDVEYSHVLIMTSVPLNITENHVKELIGAFGTIKTFNFIRTLTTSPAIVFEYEDPSIVDEVIKALNNLTVGKSKMAVQRVPLPASLTLLEQHHTLDPLLKLPPTTVIRLSNMVTENDLNDSECYIDLETDIFDECNNYGTVLGVVIPKQKGVKMGVNGVGEVFVYFSDVEHAMKAKDIIASRTYNGNPIKVVYYPENLFKMQRYALNWGEYDDNTGDNNSNNNNNDNNNTESNIDTNTIISNNNVTNDSTATINDNKTKVISMEELD